MTKALSSYTGLSSRCIVNPTRPERLRRTNANDILAADWASPAMAAHILSPATSRAGADDPIGAHETK